MIRVGVTTDRFDGAAPAYTRAGLAPVSMPCVRIHPATPEEIADTRRRAALADLLVITSPRVVSLLWPNGHMPHVDSAVVGAATASRVEQAGGRVALVGDAGLARLVELMDGRIGGRSVMIAHAAGSDAVAMGRLRLIAPDLEERAVYRTLPVAPPADRVETVAFASPSAVAGWSLSRTFEDVVIGAIGPTTGAALTRHRRADVVAEQPSHFALAKAIASFMEVRV